MHEVQEEANYDFAYMEAGTGLWGDTIYGGSDLFSLRDYEDYINMDRDMLCDISSSYWSLYKGEGSSHFH